MTFLETPGSPGPFGALLDEYARAAEEFCAVVEGFDRAAFDVERPSEDPDTLSPRTICLHVVRAAFGYATDMSKALDDPVAWPKLDVASPDDVRPGLAQALRTMETVVSPMRAWPEKQVMALTFEMPWGQLYDPEILLEHAICHLLRHRRQLERWQSSH